MIFNALVVGHGPGSGDLLASQIVMPRFNMHNDNLKILFDYGFLGMALIIIGQFVIYKRHIICLSLLIYNYLLMITDNTFIYFFHQFVCLMIVRVLYDEEFCDKSINQENEQRA